MNDAGAPHPAPPPEERRRRGRARRQRVPRASLGDWRPAADRRDPIELLREQERTRVPELLPIRHERMAESPFTFYRGAAVVFASDVAAAPRVGLDVQLCGDAHLANFGGYASPERSLVFDINDFDETLTGPFEWDLQRLAASFEVAARASGFADTDCHRVQDSLAQSYCRAMKQFAGIGHLDVWYSRLTADDIAARWGADATKSMMKQFEHIVQKGGSKDRLKAFAKLTTVVDGEPRFLSDPPLLEPARDLDGGEEYAEVLALVQRALLGYRHTLQADRRRLLDRYRFVDLARKVVGVGSVGTRCWVALFVGQGDDDPLFLQVKEAEASVLEAYVSRSEYAQHGQRVVEGQRLTQAASDILLGWCRVTGVDGLEHDYYVRQLWDAKIAVDLERMQPLGLTIYADICGYTLARAHARSGDPVELSGYVGSGTSLGKAMNAFAVAYADQNERDHAAFAASLRPPVSTG